MQCYVIWLELNYGLVLHNDDSFGENDLSPEIGCILTWQYVAEMMSFESACG